MAATTLKDDTLGKKHQEYNNLLNKALAVVENTKEIKDIDFDEPDINNLLQIDIACHNKNVEYILKVLKSDDMLYVSRAIRNSIWLITEKQYESIINPDYLETTLFPEMTTKACIKLQKSIIHNLSDESRREIFYEKENCDETRVKWLLGCSVPFIEKNIEKQYKYLNPNLIKRFCEKSVTIFKVLSNICCNRSFLTATAFLVYRDVGVYLESVESSPSYDYLEFNARATEAVMKYAPKRIINNFHVYANIIDIQIFAKYIPKGDIKSFLYRLAHEETHTSKYHFHMFFRSDKILHIIRQMPNEEQFKFVKEVFIDNIETGEKYETLPLDSNLQRMKELRDIVQLKQHVWYQFAPFEIAFKEIKDLMKKPSRVKPNEMLMSLVYAANNNLKNIGTVLNYYKNNYKNEDNSTKKKFIDNVIKHTNVNKFDNQTWSILIEIFKSMNVFEESSADDQNYVITIIVYHVIHAESLPEIIEKKFKFNSLKNHCKLLNKEEKIDVYNYLCNYLLKKIDTPITISNESEFTEALELIKQYLYLLSDWKKELLDHPLILIKIRELIEIRQKKSWKTDLSSLYNIKKGWRKHMFEESLALCPSEKVCINALKHDPTLLDRYKNEIELMRISDEVSLQHFLKKLRVYWPRSLATEWANEYFKHLTTLGSHKSVIRGLCGLLTQKQLLNIFKTYAPKQEKINWSEIDELTLSLQRNIAKNMHLARPQPNADAILLYAKGDYLSYALPSLLAIFYNMSLIRGREIFTKLVDARVSLQKHVIRFAFLKLKREDLKEIFSIIWKNTKNATIRSIIFIYTFNILCHQKEDANIELCAELLEMFIDALTSDEDKKIYELFNKIEKISITVRAKVLMKSYKLFKRLVLVTTKNNKSKDFKSIIHTLEQSSRDIMHLIPSEFATELVKNYIDESFFTQDEYLHEGYGMVNVISAYILSAKDTETQLERYEKILKPLIQRCLTSWNEMHEDNYFIRNKLQCLLSTLRMDLKEYMENINYEITHNLFSNIQTEIKSLSVPENYILLTTWNLTVELTNLLAKIDINNDWDEMCTKCAADFGKICLKYLKTDVETHFPCIYTIFVKALTKVTENIFNEKEKLQIYESMLDDKEFIQAYLGVITILPLTNNVNENLQSNVNVIMKILSTHPSVEVKMHYYYRFSDIKNDS